MNELQKTASEMLEALETGIGREIVVEQLQECCSEPRTTLSSALEGVMATGSTSECSIGLTDALEAIVENDARRPRGVR